MTQPDVSQPASADRAGLVRLAKVSSLAAAAGVTTMVAQEVQYLGENQARYYRQVKLLFKTPAGTAQHKAVMQSLSDPQYGNRTTPQQDFQAGVFGMAVASSIVAAYVCGRAALHLFRSASAKLTDGSASHHFKDYTSPATGRDWCGPT